MRSAPQICDDSVVTHLNKGRIREKASMFFHPGGKAQSGRKGMRSKMSRKRKEEKRPDGRTAHSMACFPSKHSVSGFNC